MAGFLGRLSQGMGGGSQEEEDINAPITFSRARAHPPLSSNVGTFGSTDTGLRRNWVEGSWASGSRYGRLEKAPSRPFLSIILISAFFIFAMVASIMWYDGKDQFNLNNMLPWSTGGRGSGSRPSAGSGRARGRGETRRVEEANEKLKFKYHEALRDVRGLESKVGELEHLARENSRKVQHTTRGGQDGALVEEKLKYEAAEREVDALESKVEKLEREALKQKMSMRQGQASDLGRASKEISNLQDTMERLEELEARRSREQRMSEKQIAALEKENEQLELSLEDREQDKQEIKALTDKVEELSRNSAAARRSRESGEIKKIEEAIKAHLKTEEDRVAKLTRQQIKLKAELEAARAEAQQYRKPQPAPRRKRAQSSLHLGPSNDLESTGKRLSYADEVQQKEKKEEENISRQASRMMNHREEERGLDKRHRKMLEDMERSQEMRDRTADQAADRDLKVREKEIDKLLGTNTNCPGPDCMTKKVDPSIVQATDYARSRFASGGKLRFQ
uniref:Uncharacterized protein n=1 Tax=Guillardia theta TaxID=55529 RepID=A0A7S4P049_GUITH|mmetsp:Transcript_40204/g.126526  ORF Transcript_40204/g.126526 Transcript_40204/m.126526 type:complete len:507 (+) Transcript_40204:255-1775(+)